MTQAMMGTGVPKNNEPEYWACALVLAIKTSNQASEASARANLRRLGFDVIRVVQGEPGVEGHGFPMVRS